MSTQSNWRRRPLIVSFPDGGKATEVYGFAGNSGRVNLEGQLMAGETPSDTVFLFMHPTSTLQLLPMPMALADAGLHVLCAASRYARNDAALIMEKVAIDLGQWVRHARDVLGYAKVVLVGAVPPLMLKTADNPNGTPLEVFDGIREGTALNRSQFFQDLTVPFYGFNRDGVAEVQGLRDSFWLQGMAGSIKGQYDSIREFSEVDYTADLKAIRRPTLIVHGSDDQIVPIEASAHRAAEIVQGAELKIYEGSGHGLAQLQAAQFNTDVLDFIRA